MNIPLIINGASQIQEAPQGVSFDLKANIVKVAAPVEADDAANKQYVDDAVAAGGGGGSSFSGSYTDLTDTPDLSGFATTEALNSSLYTLGKDGSPIPIYATPEDVEFRVAATEMIMNENLANVYTIDMVDTLLNEKADKVTVNTALELKADVAYVDAAVAGVSGGGSGGTGMEFSAMYRSTDQNIGILEKITFDQFHGGEAVSNAPAGETFESWTSGNGSDIWYTSWGSLFLRGNKTYLLRAVLYLNGLNSSYNCRLGWGTFDGDAYLPQYATTPLNSLMTVPVQSVSNQEIMCVVLEQVYRPTVDISISPGIISSSASGGRFNILRGSSAFVQRLA